MHDSDIFADFVTTSRNSTGSKPEQSTHSHDPVLVSGLGFGLIYLPAIVSVSCYFEKYRSLATGIAVCGSGLGTFIFAPLTEFFVDEYGWRGAILLIASLVLQCTTFGALFRPVEQYQKRKRPVPSNEPKYLTKSLLDRNGSTQETDQTDPGKLNGGNQIQRPVSIGNFSMSKQNYLQPLDKKDGDPNEMSRLARSQPVLANIPTTSQNAETSKQAFGSHSGLIDRKDVFYHGSLHSLHQLQTRRSNMRLSTEKPPDKQLLSHGENRRKPKKLCGCIPCPNKVPDTLTEMLDFSLLKDPIFILFTVSNFFTSIGFNIPYVYIVAQAQERGISKENASYLLAVIGIANTIGRVVLGYISDKPWINRLMIYNVSLAVCGIATALSALCYTFYSFAFYGSVYGFSIGAYVGLTSVILVDLMGLDHLTNAFGLLLLFQGIASLIGPPIAGWLYDAFATYDPGFVVAGVMIAISGIMLFVIPSLQRYLEKRKQSRKDGAIALT
ncbi:hypothetical protein RUM43_008827 [Polyplax serrata]|uniref:Major facilitator superfamily (MFS) profile domain-containing protein n=1 Tax=Polyplax serrata TaxID=468196 RepID=A0AAN8NNB9_POLSC